MVIGADQRIPVGRLHAGWPQHPLRPTASHMGVVMQAWGPCRSRFHRLRPNPGLVPLLQTPSPFPPVAHSFHPNNCIHDKGFPISTTLRIDCELFTREPATAVFVDDNLTDQNLHHPRPASLSHVP